MSYVLGIDGGGTKTTASIANEKGESVAEATVGPSNPNLVKQDVLIETLTSLKNELIQINPTAFHHITHLFAGVSGAGHFTAQKKIHEALRRVMPEQINIAVDHDATIALYSGTEGKAGIVQISGTGSMTYGINSEGERNRVGGWGHFVGERGSGYGLGHDALNAVFATHDGMGPKTELTEALCAHFKAATLPDLIPHIYQAHQPKEIIASLGRYVMNAADANDQVACEIIQKNGRSIGKSIAVLAKKLFKYTAYEKSDIPVVLTGGLFHRFDLFQPSIEYELNNAHIKSTLIPSKSPPVHGAVIAALGMKNTMNNSNYNET